MLLADYVETIKAISGLWLLVLVIIGGGLCFLFRKPIHQLLERASKLQLKKGDSEISFDTAPAKTAQLAAAGEPEKSDSLTPVENGTNSQHQTQKVLSSENLSNGQKSKAEDSEHPLYRMINAINENKLEVAAEAFKAIQESETDATQKKRNEMMYLYFMYQGGRDSNAIGKLENLASAKDDAQATGLEYLSNCYSQAGNTQKAITTLKQILELGPKSESWARITAKMAKLYCRTSNFDAALSLLTSALSEANDSNDKGTLFKGIAELYKQSGNTQLQALALERTLEYLPGEEDALFDAAYAQSEAELSDLAILNYHTLLNFNSKHNGAQNNLGVAFERKEMIVRSIAHYKAAVEHGNSLAMANLAYKQMNSGFVEEASELLGKAVATKDPHPNVGKALSDLAGIKEKEDKEFEKIRVLARQQKEFFWKYGDAYFIPIPVIADLSGEWEDECGHIFVTMQKGAEIECKWEAENEGMRFDGTIHNRAIPVKYQQKAIPLYSIKPSWESKTDGFAYVSADASNIALHVVQKDQSVFRTLRRVKV